MQIDFKRDLSDFSGNTLKEKDTPINLAVVAVNALMGVYPDEQNLEGTEKVRRYLLAQRIHGADGSLDIPVEDVALIKKLVGKGFPTLIAGQAIPMLEGGV